MDDRESRGRERRTITSGDPSLSPEANRELTGDLRQITGREQVAVPASRAHEERARHGQRPGLLVALHDNQLALGMTFLAAIVVGAVVSLATGSWWFLLIALVVDVAGVLLVTAGVLRMTKATEHPSPELAARLESEGVTDPDRMLTDLVHEYAPSDDDADEDRTIRPDDDPARASAEQRDAITPTDRPSRPIGP